MFHDKMQVFSMCFFNGCIYVVYQPNLKMSCRVINTWFRCGSTPCWNGGNNWHQKVKYDKKITTFPLIKL